MRVLLYGNYVQKGHYSSENLSEKSFPMNKRSVSNVKCQTSKRMTLFSQKQQENVLSKPSPKIYGVILYSCLVWFWHFVWEIN